MEKKSQGIINDILDLLQTMLISVFIISMMLTFVIRVTDVNGPSMEDTFHTGDKVIVLKLARNFTTGDVVVANADSAYTYDSNGSLIEKEGLNELIIKRVIATEGQTIDIDFETGNVTVDGVLLNEPYIKGLTHNDEGAFSGLYPLTVPKGYVFLMGDNRPVSMDSRSVRVGLVPENDVLGKAVLRVYPFDSIGKAG